MVTLKRTVRFAINDGPAGGSEQAAIAQIPLKGDNGYAGVPTMRGLGRHYELEVMCRGEVDPATGYFLDIKTIDQAVRRSVIPAIQQACVDSPRTEPGTILRQTTAGLNASLDGRLASVRWVLTPYYSVEMAANDTTTVLLRQRFEFAASHRLHTPALSDEENRKLFGKCNHPSGHGHNYIVEPCVAVTLAGERQPFSLSDLEPVVNARVIDRLDHKHLNIDIAEFDCSRKGGLNPSVENIAAVCFGWLEPAIREAGRGAATLRSITVWETEKTCATYPG